VRVVIEVQEVEEVMFDEKRSTSMVNNDDMRRLLHIAHL